MRRWLQGYSRKGQVYGPLWQPELDDAELSEGVISFRDLLELRLVAAFVKHGVSLRVIRATADFAREEFGTDYPLTARRFLTDGVTVYLAAHKSAGEEEILDLPRHQLFFSSIIQPSLYEGIEYEADCPRRWYPMVGSTAPSKVVVLDRQVQFGTPIVASAGVPTDTLHASYLAEGGDRAAVKAVARIYGVSLQGVKAAVKFETVLAARAAGRQRARERN